MNETERKTTQDGIRFAFVRTSEACMHASFASDYACCEEIQSLINHNLARAVVHGYSTDAQQVAVHDKHGS